MCVVRGYVSAFCFNEKAEQKKYERKTKKHPTGLFRPIGHFNGADNRI